MIKFQTRRRDECDVRPIALARLSINPPTLLASHPRCTEITRYRIYSDFSPTPGITFLPGDSSARLHCFEAATSHATRTFVRCLSQHDPISHFGSLMESYALLSFVFTARAVTNLMIQETLIRH